MKKILKGITSLAALAFLAAGLTGCPGTTGTNSGETSSDLWEDAVEIEELAGKEISWGKDSDGKDTSCIVPLSLAKRLQKDSKIIFELDYNSIDAEYIQLHVDDGNETTLEVVDRAIPILKEKGFDFATVPELFERKGIEKKNNGQLWTVV